MTTSPLVLDRTEHVIYVADGTVRAIGIVTLVSGPRQRMCFTPIAPVLQRLGATLTVARSSG